MSSRWRGTRPQLWSHPRFLRLSRPARLLYFELVSLADDWGRLQCTPLAVWRARYADDEDHGHPAVTRADVAKLLEEVERQGWILRYDSDGDTLAQIVGWSEKDHPAHQKVDHPSKIQALPPPPRDSRGTRDRDLFAKDSRELREPTERPSRGPREGLATDLDQEVDQDQEEDLDLPLPPHGGEPPLVEVEVEVPRKLEEVVRVEVTYPPSVGAIEVPAIPIVDGPMALGGVSRERLGLGSARPLSSDLDAQAFNAVQAVVLAYRGWHPKAFRLPPTADSPEVKAILARLAEGHTVAELCKAIDAGHRDSAWHAGHNPNGQTFVRLTTLLASSSVVTELLELAETPAEERARRKDQHESQRTAKRAPTATVTATDRERLRTERSDDIPF